MMAKPSHDDGSIHSAEEIIVQVTSTAVCGPEIYILDGYVPQMEYGDISGHEYIGNIIHSDADIDLFSRGDRVVIPLGISSLPEYKYLFSRDFNAPEDHVSIRRDDHGLAIVPHDLTDDQILLLADIYPAAKMAIDDVDIQRGDIVAISGCDIMGQIAIQYAWTSGARRVIAIDKDPEKLALAQRISGTECIDIAEENYFTALRMAAKGTGIDCFIDTAVMPVASDMPDLSDLMECCHFGGRISLPESYRRHISKIPLWTALTRKLSIKIRRSKIQKTLSQLLEQIEDGYLDTAFIHALFPQEEVPKFYDIPPENSSIEPASIWKS